MKKLCIQVCEKALLTIEVTPEMEIDFSSAGIWQSTRRSLRTAPDAVGTGRILLAEHPSAKL